MEELLRKSYPNCTASSIKTYAQNVKGLAKVAGLKAADERQVADGCTGFGRLRMQLATTCSAVVVERVALGEPGAAN